MNEQVRPAENIFGVLTNHLDRCAVVRDLELRLPEVMCDCGALQSDMARTRFKWKNLVTDAGLVYYAERAAGETPTNTFASAYVGTAGNTPAADSDYADITALATNPERAVDSGAGYPTSNDADGDNGGAGTTVTTWRFSYPASDGIGTLDRIAISVASATGTDPFLMYSEQTSWTPSGTISKTTSDTLKFFVNHTFARP